MMEFQPYAYLIGWTKLRKFYYGIQYGNKIVVANPNNLWKTYFTSSSEVGLIREREGEPDLIEVRRIFTSALKAKQWEEKVIRRMRMVKSPLWLNKGNNGSFKNIIMDENQRRLLSEGHKKNSNRKRIYFTDGENTTWCFEDEYDGQYERDGWVRGVGSKMKLRNSEGQKQYIKNLSDEERKKLFEKNSQLGKSLKGKPKPEGFSEKISKALTGIKRPYSVGENNPSATPEARKKISDSWKNRKKGNWYNNQIENFWIHQGDHIPENFIKGKVKTGPSGLKWFNDGEKEFKAFPKDKQDNWKTGRLKHDEG